MGNAAAMPASATVPSATTTIKLLISKDAQVVLYAEAGKDVIDFLLAMPAAAMIKLTSKEKDSPLGALGNLYASVERMDSDYMQSPETQEALLNPAPPPPAPSSSALAAGVEVYMCSLGGSDDCCKYVSMVKNTPCRACGGPMDSPMEVVGSSDPPSDGHGKAAKAGQGQAPAAAMGFVQGVVTYKVMDDLTVGPTSAISGIADLRGLDVTDLGSLQEKTVRVGYSEGVEILRASLQSKTVLTDVFLRKNMGKEEDAAPSNNKKLNENYMGCIPSPQACSLSDCIVCKKPKIK